MADLSTAGKRAFQIGGISLIALLAFGGVFLYPKLFPPKIKSAEIKTKATGIPPLAYDKNSHASFRALPKFNQPAEVQAIEIRGGLMGWNAANPICYAVGGAETSAGSLCDSLGLNVKLTVQNSTTEQGNGLIAFAGQLHDGVDNPTKGYTFINWMADANASYFAGLDSTLVHDYGDDYRVEVLYFTGTSYGEDKWLLTKNFKSDPKGSLTACVVRDGDWNLIVAKSQINGWHVNNALGTWDKDLVNVCDAPNGDYVASGRMLIEGNKIPLKIVSKGKYTGRDTAIAPDGVSSWFPVDQQVVDAKGGLVMMTSTKEFNAQMGCGLIFIKKWADTHKEVVENLIESFARAGDQIKSHDDALMFASRVSEVVFADKEKNAQAWYNAFKSFPLTDKFGNVVSIGGTRVFNISDNADYLGLNGAEDKYKFIYNTFGNIDHESYPEIVPSFPAYDKAVDWTFVADVYKKLKDAGVAGVASKTDFATATKGKVIGDANFRIEFNVGSAEISPSSYATLDKVLGVINMTDGFLEIDGHTDNTGSVEGNRDLSLRRAQSVKAYFAKKAPSLNAVGKITVNGFGQDQPLHPEANQNSDAVRAQNRRVEIIISGAKATAYNQ